MNSLLPTDIWIADASEMKPEFNPRFSATARRYRYLVGTDEAARSPFRRRFEWSINSALDESVLQQEASLLHGEHTFRAFAIANTAPPGDHHRCIVHRASWNRREDGVGLTFEIEANRFLHHMVRFLVGTMIRIATGRLPQGTIGKLLQSTHNQETAAPAPPHGLSLMAVRYPEDLYLPQA
jgi:tRNA pseudouridine38-40 synthase